MNAIEIYYLYLALRDCRHTAWAPIWASLNTDRPCWYTDRVIRHMPRMVVVRLPCQN